MTRTDFLDTIDSQLEWQRDLYKDFHRAPELGLEEHTTSARIGSELKDMGLTTEHISETGLVAVLENGEGPTVLARADIDPRTPAWTTPPRSTASCTPAAMTCTSPLCWAPFVS